MRKIITYICYACILGLFLYLLCSGSRTAQDGSSFNGEVNNAEGLVEQARTENKSAQHSIEQAEGRVEQAEQSNEATQAGLDECAKILDEIRNDNSRAKQIVDGIIRNAQSGTEEN